VCNVVKCRTSDSVVLSVVPSGVYSYKRSINPIIQYGTRLKVTCTKPSIHDNAFISYPQSNRTSLEVFAVEGVAGLFFFPFGATAPTWALAYLHETFRLTSVL
jgi:hypothetical protein